MVDERKPRFQSLKNSLAGAVDKWDEAAERRAAAAAETLAKGAIASAGGLTTMTVFRDGTFTLSVGLGGGKVVERDRLIAFDHDIDSMRRKSATGRGAAALMTGGLSLAATNNRGVVYVTVTGEQLGVKTYKTRNPDGHILNAVRALKAASDVVLSQATRPATSTTSPDLSAQLKALADLYTSGALSQEEFNAAKARLLS